jgi:glycosyltransferase involved in cell wall biosynthesis
MNESSTGRPGRVLHVIPSLSAAHGGPSAALPLMARSLAQAGWSVDVATTDDDGPGKRVDVPHGRRVEREGYGVFYFPKQTEFYKVSLPLGAWLRRHVRDYDVIHVHALFSHASTAAGRAARRTGVPYVIRPLGVLNRWGMENRRRWLKALSFRWVEQPLLRGAAAIHYTSEAERVEAEAAGVTTRAAVIPLGIDTAAFENLPNAELLLAKWPQLRGRKIVLFLSRLDPKKGLELLIPAFAKVRRIVPEALLVIAGDGAADYEKTCRQLAADAGISEDVVWTGYLGGEAKLAALAAASVFVLPSHSENFGIAVVEALAAGLPCVTTTGVAVSAEVLAGDAGRVVEPDSTALAAALIELLTDDGRRKKCAGNARRLASEKFSLAAMGAALAGLYEEIIAAHRRDSAE